jgi:hypothetical protein
MAHNSIDRQNYTRYACRYREQEMVMKKAMIALMLLVGITMIFAIPPGVVKVKASSETHTFNFVVPCCFPKHLPDDFTGSVIVAGLPNVPSEVQGVYWYDCDSMGWKFWAPGAPGCTLANLGGGHTYDYQVAVTDDCDWSVPLP